MTVMYRVSIDGQTAERLIVSDEARTTVTNLQCGPNALLLAITLCARDLGYHQQARRLSPDAEVINVTARNVVAEFRARHRIAEHESLDFERVDRLVRYTGSGDAPIDSAENRDRMTCADQGCEVPVSERTVQSADGYRYCALHRPYMQECACGEGVMDIRPTLDRLNPVSTPCGACGARLRMCARCYNRTYEEGFAARPVADGTEQPVCPQCQEQYLRCLDCERYVDGRWRRGRRCATCHMLEVSKPESRGLSYTTCVLDRPARSYGVEVEAEFEDDGLDYGPGYYGMEDLDPDDYVVDPEEEENGQCNCEDCVEARMQDHLDALNYEAEVDYRIGDHDHGIRVPEGWDMRGDGSLSDRGREGVSPILFGAGGMAEVFYVFDQFREAGAQMRRNVGQHLTVGAATETGRLQTQRVMSVLEEAIFATTGAYTRWEGESYCRPFKAAPYAMDKLTNDLPHNEKYCAAGPRSTAIEFRYPPGTLNYEQFAINLGMCQLVVHLADCLPVTTVAEWMRDVAKLETWHERVLYGLSILNTYGWHRGGAFDGLPYDPRAARDERVVRFEDYRFGSHCSCDAEYILPSDEVLLARLRRQIGRFYDRSEITGENILAASNQALAMLDGPPGADTPRPKTMMVPLSELSPQFSRHELVTA